MITVNCDNVYEFTLNVCNRSEYAAYDVQVKDKLQPPWIYVSKSASGRNDVIVDDTDPYAAGLVWTFPKLEAGESANVSFCAQIENSDSEPDVYNTACIDAESMPTITSNTVGVTVRPSKSKLKSSDARPRMAKISITSTVTPDMPIAHYGDIREFDMIVRNIGNTSVYDVRVKNYVTLPWIYIENSAKGGDSINGNATNLLWFINKMEPNETIVLSFRVKADHVRQKTVVRNMASVIVHGHEQASNPIDTFVSPPIPDLTVVKSIKPVVPPVVLELTSAPPESSVPFCPPIQYIITARNISMDPITNVNVTNLVSDKYYYIPKTMKGGISQDDSHPFDDDGLVWTVGTLAPGTSETLSFKVRAKDVNGYSSFSTETQARLNADQVTDIVSNVDSKTIECADFFAKFTSPTTFTLSGDGTRVVEGTLHFEANPVYKGRYNGGMIQTPYYPGDIPPEITPGFKKYTLMNPSDITPPLHDGREWALIYTDYKHALKNSLIQTISTITVTFSEPVQHLYISVHEIDMLAYRFKSAIGENGEEISATALARQIDKVSGNAMFLQKSGIIPNGTFVLGHPTKENHPCITGTVRCNAMIKELVIESTGAIHHQSNDYMSMTFALLCPDVQRVISRRR